MFVCVLLYFVWCLIVCLLIVSVLFDVCLFVFGWCCLFVLIVLLVLVKPISPQLGSQIPEILEFPNGVCLTFCVCLFLIVCLSAFVFVDLRLLAFVCVLSCIGVGY